MQPINERPRLRPIIRIFVSSTFRDMFHERNSLQKDVFPKLEQLCQQNGFQFQAIDLRWGVSSEASLDHRAMRICFNELRRAQEVSPKPNFLILLGDRYGWQPLPEEISQEEFAALEHAASKVKPAAGISPGIVLRQWYRRKDPLFSSSNLEDKTSGTAKTTRMREFGTKSKRSSGPSSTMRCRQN